MAMAYSVSRQMAMVMAMAMVTATRLPVMVLWVVRCRYHRCHRGEAAILSLGSSPVQRRQQYRRFHLLVGGA